MSRVAKNPIAIPNGISVEIQNQYINIKNSKEIINHQIPNVVKVLQENNTICIFPENSSNLADAQAGCTRALINNIVIGLTKGFERKLELFGVGYRAQVQGKILNLTLGFSHPVAYNIPTGIIIETPSQTEVVVKGSNKQLVGQVAAEIRAYRPPEPYKGKGVRYANEKIILKEVKKK